MQNFDHYQAVNKLEFSLYIVHVNGSSRANFGFSASIVVEKNPITCITISRVFSLRKGHDPSFV